MAQICEFGTAPNQEGFKVFGVIEGTKDDVLAQYADQDVRLVIGAGIWGKQDHFEFAVMRPTEEQQQAGQARNWVSVEGLRNLAACRGISVAEAYTEEDVSQAELSMCGMRAMLENRFARSWRITEVGESYGRGFEVSAEVLSRALDAFAEAARARKAN